MFVLHHFPRTLKACYDAVLQEHAYSESLKLQRSPAQQKRFHGHRYNIKKLMRQYQPASDRGMTWREQLTLMKKDRDQRAHTAHRAAVERPSHEHGVQLSEVRDELIKNGDLLAPMERAAKHALESELLLHTLQVLFLLEADDQSAFEHTS